MARTPKKAPSPAWMRSKKLQRFIMYLKQDGNVSEALRKGKVTRSYVYDRRQTDLEFADAFEAARLCGREVLVDEAHRRAYRGVRKEIYHQGEVVGTEQRYSDTLLMFLIKQQDPSYREHYSIDHGNADGRPFMFNFQLHPDVAKQQGAR